MNRTTFILVLVATIVVSFARGHAIPEQLFRNRRFEPFPRLPARMQGLWVPLASPLRAPIIREEHGDWVLQETVPTRQCRSGRACRAQLVLERHGDVLHVSAGYKIFRKDGRAVNVDATTKRRIQATTPQQADEWAIALLAQAAPRLQELDVHLSQDDIASALLNAAQAVLACTRTDEPACNTLGGVRDVDLGPTGPEVSTCASTLRSQPDVVQTVADLQGICPETRTYYYGNFVSAELPFCVTRCAGAADASPHVVYMEFTAHKRVRSESVDCLTSLLAQAYDVVFPTLPDCADAPDGYGNPIEMKYTVPLVSTTDGTFPDALQTFAKERGCGPESIYFIAFKAESLQQVVESSCTAQ